MFVQIVNSCLLHITDSYTVHVISKWPHYLAQVQYKHTVPDIVPVNLAHVYYLFLIGV